MHVSLTFQSSSATTERGRIDRPGMALSRKDPIQQNQTQRHCPYPFYQVHGKLINRCAEDYQGKYADRDAASPTKNLAVTLVF